MNSHSNHNQSMNFQMNTISGGMYGVAKMTSLTAQNCAHLAYPANL
ncbi:hypothetical protein KBD20_03195 [Candidatus Saccharibacteria bacterium]|nr:hypothetical protein [Candidatus Saccharibacteria bacterium]